MTEATLESLLKEYARTKLSPTGTERDRIKVRYEQLQTFLGGQTFQSGSYARFTSTTPVNDLDVIYVLPDEVLRKARAAQMALDPANLNIHDILESLAGELRRRYAAEATIEVQPHSIGIFFGEKHEFSIDVVPAAPAPGGMYWIPEVGRSSVTQRRLQYLSWQGHEPPSPNWILTHPKGYIAQASGLDASTAGMFRKATKVLKKWRWSCKRENDSFKLKSFHLELAATRWFQKNPNSRCIDAVRGVVAELDDLITTPQFQDLADSTRFVDEYIRRLSTAEQTLLRDQFERAQYLWAEFERSRSTKSAQTAFNAFLGLDRVPTAGGAATTATPIVAVAPPGEREGEEEYLSDYQIAYQPQYRVKIDATVIRDGFRPYQLLARAVPFLPKLRSLEFFIASCSAPEPFDVRWKVKNAGTEASRKNALRGRIYPDEGRRRRKESSLYWGNHYVECYVIKDGACVAADHVEVPIGPKE